MNRLFPIWKQSAMGWLYPPTCSGCDLPVASHRQIELPFLCEPCEKALTPIPEGYCPVCGQSYDAPVAISVPCGNCGGRTLAFDFAVSAYRSSGPIREIMHAYKYGRQLHLSRLFGKLLQRVWNDPRLAETTHWSVVPVPLHPKRQRKRGFNQATEIAREFIRSAPPSASLELTSLLKRSRHTIRQAQLDRRERLENLKDAFSLRKDLPPFESLEQGILLVDDVMTTGTTVSECAEVLRRAYDENGTETPPIAGITVLRG